MNKKLFLLDGMALVYRAHFALISKPIFTSKGVNSSALYGFTQTLLEILKNQQPTHLAVAFDTDAPTHRHTEFADYKATRQAMPEDLSLALPHVRRMIEAFRIPVLVCDGYEADDIIGTVVRRAEKEGFTSYMVTPDKDFGQLVDKHTFVYKPSRMGDAVEIMGLPEIRQRWGIERAEQVVDVLALMGDSSDNIPGVPGIGEKTATKLIGQYGSLENLLNRTGELKGRQKEMLEQNAELARVSKRLATILCDVPCPVDLESLKLQERDDEAVKALFVEFEFNSIGKRLFGDEFKAGRGFSASQDKSQNSKTDDQREGELVLESETEVSGAAAPSVSAKLTNITAVQHDYRILTSAEERSALIAQLKQQPAFAISAMATGPDAKQGRLLGLAFSFNPHAGWYVPMPAQPSEARKLLKEFEPVLRSPGIEKVGHNLKFELALLKWMGIESGGKLFDTMIAHSLLEPDLRHGIQYLAETFLGYAPISFEALAGGSEQLELTAAPLERISEYAVEKADLNWQLRQKLEPLLKDKGQERVFYDVEAPLVRVLVEMEFEGIRLDAEALAEFGSQLAKEIDEQEKTICRLAGTTFNLNSPRQLGQILFDVMKICAAPKKTKSGQYSTDEQTLMALAPDHEIVRRLLDHRTATKLKSTYADALP
ncbi:MAG TPA: DNA polymerase, partial [Verrucomicrobiae bacterium]|nr:DNA polymerase [Verrucomicrobiae bacterium]